MRLHEFVTQQHINIGGYIRSSKGKHTQEKNIPFFAPSHGKVEASLIAAHFLRSRDRFRRPHMMLPFFPPETMSGMPYIPIPGAMTLPPESIIPPPKPLPPMMIVDPLPACTPVDKRDEMMSTRTGIAFMMTQVAVTRWKNTAGKKVARFVVTLFFEREREIVFLTINLIYLVGITFLFNNGLMTILNRGACSYWKGFRFSTNLVTPCFCFHLQCDTWSNYK